MLHAIGLLHFQAELTQQERLARPSRRVAIHLILIIIPKTQAFVEPAMTAFRLQQRTVKQSKHRQTIGASGQRSRRSCTSLTNQVEKQPCRQAWGNGAQGQSQQNSRRPRSGVKQQTSSRMRLPAIIGLRVECVNGVVLAGLESLTRRSSCHAHCAIAVHLKLVVIELVPFHLVQRQAASA